MASWPRERPRPTDGHADFLRVVQPLVGSLLAVSRRVLGSDDLAWDAVQEALLSLWLEGPLPPNPRAWLIRTVIHRSLHLARCRARRRRHEERASRGRSEPSDRDDPAGRLEVEEVRGTVRDALREISQEHRVILELNSVAGMDYASISALLRIPEGTVRSRLHRSRQALRQVLVRSLPENEKRPTSTSPSPESDHS